METRKKIVALAQKIASSPKEFTQQDPEYYALECVVTDEHADVALQDGCPRPDLAFDAFSKVRQIS